MPLRALCATCGTLIPAGHTRCPEHQRSHNRQRNQRLVAQIYADPRWRICRSAVLERDGHKCVLCHAPGTIADHYPEPLRELLHHGKDPFNTDTCRTLCHPCSGHADGGRRGGPVGMVGGA